MVFAASLLLLAGYTLVYAGVKGVAYNQPWQLLVGSATNAPGSSITGTVPGPGGTNVLPGAPVNPANPPYSTNPTGPVV